MGMLFDPMTGKVIEENVADPSDLGPTGPQLGQHGFMPGMEPAAIRSIQRVHLRRRPPRSARVGTRSGSSVASSIATTWVRSRPAFVRLQPV